LVLYIRKKLLGLGEAQQIIGEATAKVMHPMIGWAVSGTLLGGFLGLITGLALIKLIKWPAPET
jgi:hypothetical protein